MHNSYAVRKHKILYEYEILNWVVHTKICTDEIYPLYSIDFYVDIDCGVRVIDALHRILGFHKTVSRNYKHSTQQRVTNLMLQIVHREHVL